MSTGAFPGPEVPTEGEPVSLTETAKVLSILFSFVYPKRHPDLEDLDFSVVAAVAEAAGKYEVFAAMIPCNVRLTYVGSLLLIVVQVRPELIFLYQGNFSQRMHWKYSSMPLSMTILN